ncbi:alpha/beta hydrolase [Pseudonocardia sp.]|uniref:alpha/beta fold hydrolase n=1 Tax=Pseudonocardia sp. TaxID=60912 RepID=UPI00261D6FFF|nr:alpha/beta hydrolase [Pseudonocardia sp.]
MTNPLTAARLTVVAGLVTVTALTATAGVVGSGVASAGPSSDPAVVAASVAPDNGRTCTTSELPVDLQPGVVVAPGSDLGVTFDKERNDQFVVVKLCTPDGADPTAVQVLTHGITYDHRYWNIADPADPAADTYSWEAAAARAGYATASIDRIGNGASSHPLSAFVDITSNATALHGVVQALRAGTVDGQDSGFDRVALVGHSYGSFTSMIEASRFRDVDAVLLTGFSHRVNNRTPVAIETSLYPTLLDPQFAGELLDPGYATPRPGTHRSLFYAPGDDVDPRIIERDAATKGTVTQSELANFPLIEAIPLDIDVPVFIINGDRDGIFCNQQLIDLGTDCSSAERVVEQERPFFPKAPSVEAYVVEGPGHDLNAFFQAPEAFEVSMDWLQGVVPASG